MPSWPCRRRSRPPLSAIRSPAASRGSIAPWRSFARKPLFNQAGFAVADLSGRYSRYAGWNLNKPRFSGSVLKITAIFAALQLRERLNLAAKGLTKDEVFPKVTAAWSPLVARSVAGPANFPQLDKIFLIKSDGEIEFTLEFAKKLVLMATNSDPPASGECIRLLGHQYINGGAGSRGAVFRQAERPVARGRLRQRHVPARPGRQHPLRGDPVRRCCASSTCSTWTGS